MSPELLGFLWLEDQPLNKEDIVSGLEWTFFCSVRNVGDCDSFLDALRAEKFALILLDLRLPCEGGGERQDDVIDPDYGFTALRRFREEHAGRGCETARDVPVIALTARFDEAARKEATALGIAGYVIKPFTYRQLTEAITNVLRMPGVLRTPSSG